MTKEEKQAIASLKRAFTKCDKLGLKFSGMDNTLLYCTEESYNKARENRRDSNTDYNEVAYAIQERYEGADTLLNGFPYVDSGGW